MAKLIFYDTGHIYEVDGEEYPSVSEVSRFASREVYGEVAQYNLDVACSRGGKVHKATEVLDKYSQCEVDEDISNYIASYIQFRKDYCITQYDYIEKPFAHEELKYAGTIDRVYTIDEAFAEKFKEQTKIDISHLIGKKVIIDIKTSNVVQKVLAKIQLNGYKKGFEQNGWGEIGLLCILHLQKDGNYKLIPFDIDETLFMACLTLHNAFRKKKKVKKEIQNDGKQ